MIANFLQDLTVGQVIIIECPHAGRRSEFYRTTVTRFTDASVWTAEGERFNRRTGVRSGTIDEYLPVSIATVADTHSDVVRLMTESEYLQEALQARTEKLKRRLINDIRSADLSSLSNEALGEISDLICARIESKDESR